MANEAVTIVLPDDASPELVERIRAAFPEATLDGAQPAAAPDADAAIATAASGAGMLPDALGGWISAFPNGFITALLTAAAVFVLAYLAERAALGWLGGARGSAASDARARLSAGLGHLARRAVGVAAFAAAAAALARLAATIDPGGADLARTLFATALWARGLLALVEALTAPAAPGRRLMGLTDAEAQAVWRAMLPAITLLAVLQGLRAMLIAAAGTGPTSALALTGLTVAATAVQIVWLFAIRTPIGALIGRATGGAADGWRALLAARWHWIYVALAVTDGALKAMGALGMLRPEAADGAGPSMAVMILAPLAVAGLAAWREAAPPTRAAGWTNAAYALAEGLIIVGASIALLNIWGIDPFQAQGATGLARLAPALVEAALVCVAGIALWRAASTLLSGEAAPEAGIADEENVRAATRAETILPILRGFALALVAILTGMTALSALGLDITPLLASAGVLGLAIGFGAQKLVTDVINGLFYLYEDAFRVGEYIETASGKGVVEKISLRSVRLRHHRGPVFTIPFSSMGTIQNHSRDWVKVKFTFAVPSDVDVEMVRKLVKKVGEALLTDPDLEGKFLEPLKSQGAVAISGSAYEIGCKFTTRPGQQFLIRRKALAALQKALEERDIALFAPQLRLAAEELLQHGTAASKS